MTDMHTKPLDENLSFESLLGELSAKLVNLPLESIDAAIESSIKKLTEFFHADRCHLGEFSADQSKLLVSYFYSRPGINIPQIADIGEHYLSFIYFLSLHLIQESKNVVLKFYHLFEHKSAILQSHIPYKM